MFPSCLLNTACWPKLQGSVLIFYSLCIFCQLGYEFDQYQDEYDDTYDSHNVGAADSKSAEDLFTVRR